MNIMRHSFSRSRRGTITAQENGTAESCEDLLQAEFREEESAESHAAAFSGEAQMVQLIFPFFDDLVLINPNVALAR